MTLLTASGLCKRFPGRRRGDTPHSAVEDVSFELAAGETLALVGESGAGKSTTGRMIVRLIEPDAGSIMLGDLDVRALRPKELRRARTRLQMIFQDPFSSLDPRIPILQSVTEPLVVLRHLPRKVRRERAAELLNRVGIGPQLFDRFPTQLSGGQLQRIAIARALTVEPELIVCDEPVAALDMSVRAQVLNLLKDLQEEYGVAFLFISHDLALVEVIADRILVMSNGRIVEAGDVEQIYAHPTHPYTKELLEAIPRPTAGRRRTRESPAAPRET